MNISVFNSYLPFVCRNVNHHQERAYGENCTKINTLGKGLLRHHWEKKSRQLAIIWQLQQNCYLLVPEMQPQVSYHHHHPLSPGKPLKLLVTLSGTSSQKHFFPPATLPHMNALIPRITSTLDILFNQILPIFQFQVRGAPLPSPLALWSYYPKRRAIGLEEEPL